MKWLLIGFLIAVVLSPLMWMRQSPGQQRVTQHRRDARSKGIQVNLQPRPEAREGENRLEAVCYRAPWTKSSVRQNWVLHRYSERGWPSDLPGWNCAVEQLGGNCSEPVYSVARELPVGVRAIVADARGLGLIWDEKGDTEQCALVCEKAGELRNLIQENCP